MTTGKIRILSGMVKHVTSFSNTVMLREDKALAQGVHQNAPNPWIKQSMNPIIEFLGTNLGSHSIKKWALVMGILSASFSLSLMAEEQYKSLNVDLRIMAGQDSYVFRCTATNNSTNNISIPLASGFMADANIFLYNSLGDVDRQLMHTGVAVSWDPDNLPDPLMISGNSLYKEYLDKDTFLLFSGYPTNTYLSLVWGVGKQAKPLVSRVINPLLYCRDLVYYAA